MKIRKRVISLTVSLSLLMALSVLPTLANSGNGHEFEIVTLSTAPDMVSGGDVLVQVKGPEHVSLNEVKVTLNGVDVTNIFKTGPDYSLVGLVEGLKLGDNHLMAKAGHSAASLKVTNYPITGPIFSGHHEAPFICETVASNLGTPVDAECSVAARIDYFYKSTLDNTFKPLSTPLAYPGDVASTTIYGGKTVPYVVRLESGTINRGIYRIAILDDPAHAPAGPWKPGAGWNGKLQYTFGGGCGYGKHQGNNQPSAVLDDNALSRGFAVATSTLDTYGTACNDVLSAETAMMVKEHFIERYGLLRYTRGLGSSGGAMQQHLVSQDYPGILDALLPTSGFPDGQTLTHEPHDCALLIHYFDGATIPWTDAEKIPVSGEPTKTACLDWNSNWGAQYTNPGTNSYVAKCAGNSVIPLALRYDPVSNPGGVRCTMYDSMINLYGEDPKTGFARRPLDNVGIQYGLKALNAGEISPEQFLDLNGRIGGFDIDGNFVSQRTECDAKTAEISYATGRVFTGKDVFLPILYIQADRDFPTGNVHGRFRAMSIRERILDANDGSAPNHIMWVIPPTTISTNTTGLAMDMLDQWMENLLSDTSHHDYASKVVHAKPAQLKDGCWDPSGNRIDEPMTMDPNSKCNTLYPIYGNPRIAAGSSIKDDVVKCKLEPVNKHSYAVAFTPAQWARLKTVFPHGVCDYSKPGFGQNHNSEPWLSFGPAPQDICCNDHDSCREDHNFNGHGFDH
jgi:hypothetical protein